MAYMGPGMDSSIQQFLSGSGQLGGMRRRMKRGVQPQATGNAMGYQAGGFQPDPQADMGRGGYKDRFAGVGQSAPGGGCKCPDQSAGAGPQEGPSMDVLGRLIQQKTQLG